MSEEKFIIEYDASGFVKNYLCPSCKHQLKLDYEDDVGTKFFKCEHCGKQTSTPTTPEKQAFLEMLRAPIKVEDPLATDPEVYQKYLRYVSQTVKHDKVGCNLIFLTGLSTYTSEPINTFLRGESTIGKTYLTTNVLQVFPKNDVWLLGGLSPTALIHDHGVLIDAHGNEIEFMEKPGKKATQEDKDEYKEYKKRLRESRYLVDLQGKILVFLEAPAIETFNKLRPILSHDTFEISYKFTDKELRARHVIIRGWPATIFCSTSEKYVQDLATRSFTHTPEMTETKYKAANILTGSKTAFPWKFDQEGDRADLVSYISTFKKAMEKLKATIPFAEKFAENFPHRFPRSMRDFKHLLGLIQVRALVHFAQRPILIRRSDQGIRTYVLAIKEDYDAVASLWKDIRETTETSASTNIIKFFNEVVKLKADEKAKAMEEATVSDVVFTVKELADLWNSKYSDRKSSDSIRKWVDFLCQIGYMSKEPNREDKRENLLKIIKGEENGNKTKKDFSAFFTFDSFKAWLNEAEQITPSNQLLFKANILDEYESTPEEIYEKYYLCKATLNGVIGLRRSSGSSDKSDSKTAEEEESV